MGRASALLFYLVSIKHSFFMIRRKKVLTKEERARRKNNRHLFIKQRRNLFYDIKEKFVIRIPLDWRGHLKDPVIQSIIQDARDILYYSPTTDDYSIWVVLFYHYEKKLKHESPDSRL
jgi:hypothetical protein